MLKTHLFLGLILYFSSQNALATDACTGALNEFKAKGKIAEAKNAELKSAAAMRESIEAADADSNMLGGAKSLKNVSFFGTQVDQATKEIFAPSYKTCVSVCEAAYTQGGPNEAALKLAYSNLKECHAHNKILHTKLNLSQLALGETAIKAAKVAAVVGGGALLLKAVMGSDSKGGGGGSSGSGSSGAGAGGAAGEGSIPLNSDGTVNCQKVSDPYNHSDCDSIYVEHCDKQPEAKGCDQFSERYCGLKENEETEKESENKTDVAANQLGEFCKTQMGLRYCEKGQRDHCPTCSQLKTRYSPACASDPAVCMSPVSRDAMIQAQTSCPTDPKFSDPEVVKMIQDPGMQYGASSNSTDELANNPKSGSLIGASGSETKGDVSADKNGSTTDLGSADKSNLKISSTEIKPAHSAGLLVGQNQSIQQLCAENRLNQCGPQAQMRRPSSP